jgi:hypothetical protein
MGLCEEYTFRYGGKTHRTQERMYDVGLRFLPRGIPKGNLTKHPQCMPDEYKTENAVDAYRSYYIGAKSPICKWTHREIPGWWPSSSLDIRQP